MYTDILFSSRWKKFWPKEFKIGLFGGFFEIFRKFFETLRHFWEFQERYFTDDFTWYLCNGPDREGNSPIFRANNHARKTSSHVSHFVVSWIFVCAYGARVTKTCWAQDKRDLGKKKQKLIPFQRQTVEPFQAVIFALTCLPSHLQTRKVQRHVLDSWYTAFSWANLLVIFQCKLAIKVGNIVAKANVSQFSRAWNICCTETNFAARKQKKNVFTSSQKHFCFPDINFVSETYVSQSSQFSHHENNVD